MVATLSRSDFSGTILVGVDIIQLCQVCVQMLSACL